MKDANGTGLDFLLRVQHNEYGTIKDAKLGLPEVIGYTLKNDSVVQQNSVGAGARYSLGAAAGGIRFQGYALAYYQYSRVTADLWYIRNSGSASGKKSYAYNSHGVCGGIGVEASLRYAGVFAEYTWGYSPAFENSTNVESGMFRAGVTIRTPLL